MWDYAGVWIFCRGNEDASRFDRDLDAVICNGGTRPLVMPCARCGMSAVYNPRPGEDLVVCGDCGYEMGRDAMRSRVLEWRDSWFVAGDDDDSLTALRTALDGAA